MYYVEIYDIESGDVLIRYHGFQTVEGAIDLGIAKASQGMGYRVLPDE